MNSRLFIGRLWPFWAAVAAAVMLAIAHGFETFGHMPPCQLCLRQREVYWAAFWIGILGWRLELAMPGRRFGAIFAGLLVLVFLGQTWLALYHAGAEWKWWPGPRSCSGQGTVNVQDLTALMRGARIKGPSCEVAAWRWLGLSMAGWNALIALGLAVLSMLSFARAWCRPAKAAP
jgi:disulfide bond formation protein DsbB